MDKPLPISTDLLIKHEVLRARFEIRDFYLHHLFREVYENVGQILSLAKMQLEAGAATLIKHQADPMASAGELVGRSITDLREMCKDFYPDVEVLKENGFAHGIRKIMQIIDPDTQYLLKIKEMNIEMEYGVKLIVFNMMLETLVLIKKAKGALVSLVMGSTKEDLALWLMYKGEAIGLGNQLAQSGGNGELNLRQRAQLLKGNLIEPKHSGGKNKIKLILPLNQPS